jgi:hypothetical protein
LLVLTTFTDMETNMPNTPKVLIINAVTGVEELRDMNAEELAQYEADKASDAEKESAKAAVEAKKAELLERLGITADEAKLLLS